MTRERWRPVVNFEGLYEVSDLGRIRSLDHVVMRSNGSPMTIRGRIRKAPLITGYPALVLCRTGKKTNYYVHHVVATAFIGPRPLGMEVAHWDGDKLNVALSNLRYATPLENDADKIRHQTRMQGERHGRAVLSENDVLEIRRRVAKGEKQNALSAIFGISSAQTNRIVQRRLWRHI